MKYDFNILGVVFVCALVGGHLLGSAYPDECLEASPPPAVEVIQGVTVPEEVEEPKEVKEVVDERYTAYELAVLSSERTKRFEGFSATPYLLAGIWHIGYGSTITDDTSVRTITEEDAEDWMLSDLTARAEDLYTLWEGYEELSLNTKLVLLDMAYNMGTPNLLGFKNLMACTDTLCRSAEIMDSLYATQVPTRAKSNIEYLWSEL